MMVFVIKKKATSGLFRKCQTLAYFIIYWHQLFLLMVMVTKPLLFQISFILAFQGLDTEWEAVKCGSNQKPCVLRFMVLVWPGSKF